MRTRSNSAIASVTVVLGVFGGLAALAVLVVWLDGLDNTPAKTQTMWAQNAYKQSVQGTIRGNGVAFIPMDPDNNIRAAMKLINDFQRTSHVRVTSWSIRGGYAVGNPGICLTFEPETAPAPTN